MKDQFVKRFESLSEDFIYYMRSVEHLKDNTVQNYISWLKFLSESYPIDEKIEEKDIIKILEQEKKSCLERNTNLKESLENTICIQELLNYYLHTN